MSNVPPSTAVSMPKYGQGRKEPPELQGMESEEVETDESNGQSDEVQSDHQRSAGNRKDCDDKGSIFSLIVDHAPTRAAAPVRRAAQLMALNPTADGPSGIGGSTKTNSETIGIGSPKRVNNPSIGSVPGGRKACRLEWTAADPTGTVEGRTRGNIRSPHAVHCAGPLGGEVGLVWKLWVVRILLFVLHRGNL